MEQTETTPTLNDASAALAFADSSFADPAADAAPTDSSPAPASTEPAATEPAAEPVTAQATPEKKHEPFVPYERFNEVNESKKLLETQLKDLEWAATLSPQDRQHLFDIRQALATNPAEFIAQAWQHLENDPKHAPALKSQAARLLASRQQAQQPAAEPEPEFMVDLGDGRIQFDPRGLAQWKDWTTKQIAATLETQFAQKFQPLTTTAEKLAQLEQQAQLQQQSQQWAASVTKPLEKLPYFEEFKPELGKALNALPATATDAEMQAAIYETYTRLHTAKLDTLTKQGQANAMAQLQQRAVSGTGNSASATTATPPSTLGDARAALEAANRQLGVA